MKKAACFCDMRGGRCDDGGCDHAVIGPWTPTQCRVCWLRLNGPAPSEPAAVMPLAAKRAEAKAIESAAPGTWPLAVRAVARLRIPQDRGVGDTVARHASRFGGDFVKRLLKRLTGRDCGCANRQAWLNQHYAYTNMPREPETVRNLLMHVLPVAGNGVWRWNVAQVLKRINMFNGRRIVAVCTPTAKTVRAHLSPTPQPTDRTYLELDSAAEVKKAFAGHVHEFVEVPNDPNLREVATFLPLFERLENVNPLSVTFYCQAKGVTHQNGQWTPTRWAEVMYETLLDYWPLTERALRTHSTVSVFKWDDKAWQESVSAWTYSGSFWWQRDAALFSQPNWRKIDQFWSGIEPYLSLHFPTQKAACLFHPLSWKEGNLYDPSYFERVVEPAFAKWKREHTAQRKEW